MAKKTKSKWDGFLPPPTPVAEKDFKAETTLFFGVDDVDEKTPTNQLINDLARYVCRKLDDVAELLQQQAKKRAPKSAAKKVVKRPRVRVSPLFKN